MAPPKQKGQKMGLGEFLTDTSLGSWADEMEDAPLPSSGSRGGMSYGGGDRSYGSGGGGGGASSFLDRGFSQREQLPLPSKPPFTVHLGNMSFDATEGDVMDFFAGCEITSVRIVEDKLDRKPKGFGYAEFGTLEGLKKALDLNGSQFQGRNMRISVAEPQKDRSDAREISDWTRKGPLPDISGPKRTPSGFAGGRGYEAAPDRGSDRGERGDRGGDRGERRFNEQGDGKLRDFNNWERKGPLTPSLPPQGQSNRQNSNESRERRDSPAWGEGRSQDGSRPPKREFVERPAPPDRAPTAADQDNQWRARMRPDAPAPASPSLSSKELSVPSSPAAPAAPTAPATRPKLNLQKRTVSTAAEPSPSTATPSDSKPNPFGAARPIDTASREKEIEEKLKAKKEQEKEEKRVADEKAKEDRKAAKEDKAGKTNKSNGQNKESEDGEGTAGRNYQILRREAEDQSNEPDEEDTSADVTIDKEVKPREVVRDAKGTNGSGAEQTSAEGLEDEGWSTVSKPQKGRRGGNAGSRALAS